MSTAFILLSSNLKSLCTEILFLTILAAKDLLMCADPHVFPWHVNNSKNSTHPPFFLPLLLFFNWFRNWASFSGTGKSLFSVLRILFLLFYWLCGVMRIKVQFKGNTDKSNRSLNKRPKNPMLRAGHVLLWKTLS